METKHFLRRRILTGFLWFGLVVVAFSVGTFVKAYYDGQDSLQEAVLLYEVERIQRGRIDGNETAPSGHLRAFTRLDDMPAPYAALVTGLEPGLHEMETEFGPARERDMAVWVGKLRSSGEPLWVFFDLPDTETIPRIAADYMELAAAYCAALLLFGGWLAATVSRRISRPLEEFAREIEQQSPGEWAGDFSQRYGQGEIGSLATALDTTIQRNRRLLERERIFMQNASHELRTPITVVRGASEVLESLPDVGGTAGRRAVARIGRAARDMQALSEAFLWLGREPEPDSATAMCSAEDVVKVSMRQTIHLLENKPVEIRLTRKHPLRVNCRSEFLEIAMSNLLRNAFQHWKQGCVEISIEESAIEVIDDGPGLPDVNADQVKRRNRRGPGSDGFGVGLAIVEQICERMGWRLRLENRSTGGCRARLEGLSDRTTGGPASNEEVRQA
jgi:signal transduction histidine kinase